MTVRTQTHVTDPAPPVVARPAGSGSLTPWMVAVAAPFGLSILVGLIGGGVVYVSPYQNAVALQRHFAANSTNTSWVALLQLCSALALGVATGLLAGRMRALAPRMIGATYVAVIGGTLAAGLLALNALVQWVLTRGAVVSDVHLVKALSFFFFGLGGFAHVAALGLLVGGVTAASVPGRLLPRWVVVAGVVVAAASVLSICTLVTQGATTLIPIGRFLGLVWLVVVTIVLPGTASGSRR